MSAVDVRQILSQLPPKMLLDPFCGSGTIVYEAGKLNFNVFGIDSNPIAIQIAKAKFDSIDAKESIDRINYLIKNNGKDKSLKMPIKALKYFHEKTAQEIMYFFKQYDKFSDYEKAAFLGSICLVARGCNHYKWSSTQIGKISDTKRYIDFYKTFINKIKKHCYPLRSSNHKLFQVDARNLSNYIQEKSIDYVYTSPPYFDALDYTSNYTRIIHHLFGNDINDIKKYLIQNYDSYEDNMKKCFIEISKVTKEDALIIFVVGDKKRGDKYIKGGDFFSNICDKKPNMIIEREYTKTASSIWDKINQTQRKEQIVIWDKSTW